jgi:hypothetical protein
MLSDVYIENLFDKQVLSWNHSNGRFENTSMTAIEEDPYSLHLNQEVPEQIINGIPLLEPGRVIDENHQLVDKLYVDNAVTALGQRFYMLDEHDLVESALRLTSITPSDNPTETYSKLLNTSPSWVMGWMSPPDYPVSKLIAGVYDFNLFAAQTGGPGKKDVKLYWRLSEYIEESSVVVIGTSPISDVIDEKRRIQIYVNLSEDYIFTPGSRIIGEVYAVTEGSGGDPTITLYYEGEEDSHWEIPTNTEVLQEMFSTISLDNITSAGTEKIQDDIGSILDDGSVGNVVFTYDDSTPLISATVSGGGTETDPLSLHLDQTTPQHIENGAPIFDEGVTIGDDKYIGSESYPNAIKIGDEGELYFMKDLLGTDQGSYNHIMGENIFSMHPGGVAFVHNNVLGHNVGELAIGQVLKNFINGYDVGGSITNRFYSNIINGNEIGETATGDFVQNLINGNNLFESCLTTIQGNITNGYNIAQKAEGSVLYNILNGYNTLSLAQGSITYNNINGFNIFRTTTGNIGSNLINGREIGYYATGNIENNLINGSFIGNSVTGNFISNIGNGVSLFNAATGSLQYSLISGGYSGNTLTGNVQQVVSVGLFNLYNTTNATNAYRVIAMPYEALRESSASDINDAIAIGTKAGYQNQYNNPALFGVQATATANKQVVIGSAWYTGGILLDGNVTVPDGKTFTAETTYTDILNLKAQSTDPADPPNGETVIWMSDGTGLGDEGDFMMKITVSGVTKTIILVDYSAI